MTGHRFDKRSPSCGRREVQCAVQRIGQEYIPVGTAEEWRRIGPPILVVAVSNALNGISKGQDRRAVGDALRDFRHWRQIPNQPMAIGLTKGDVQVL